MSNLLIIGAGGHGKVVADAASSMQKWDKICFLDDSVISSNRMAVVGRLDYLSELTKDFSDVVVAIGDNYKRSELLLKSRNLGFNLPAIIHSHAWISSSAEIGAGSVVFAGAIINAGAKIGFGSIINTSAVVEHDCVIDDYVHISPKAALAGRVRVGECSWIGIGANIINGIQIGENVIIGAGSVVIDDIEDNVVVVGVPAKVIKKSI